jgi:hypothetical protein
LARQSLGEGGNDLTPKSFDSFAPARFGLSVCPSLSLAAPQLHSRAGDLTRRSHFPRYIAPDFLQYLCERNNKRMKRLICSTFPVFTLACFALAQQAPDSVSISVITTFDYPGTGNSTFPQKINDTNDIVGGYVDSSGVTRGFVRLSDGTFSEPIVDPNDTCIFHYTLASGINNSRLICGD